MAATVRIAILANATKARVTIDRTRKSLNGLGRAAKGVGKMVAPLAAFTSLIGPAVTGVLALSKALVAVGNAAVATAPLLAFAPSLVGGFFLLKSTLTTVATAMGEALKPVQTAFEQTNKAVSTIAKQGLPALGREFVKVNMPAIDNSMRRIARSANANVRAFGKWVNTAPGMKLIRDTSSGVAAAFERAAPHITTAVIALGNLANRAGVADRLARLGDVVGSLADRFSRWADSVSAADIDQALKNLRDASEGAREKLAALRDIIEWLAANQAKIKAFSNALAGIALAVGIFTGNWVAVAIAGFTLLLNNFEFVKTAFAGLRDFWATTWQAISTNPAFIALKQAVSDLFTTIKNEAQPVWESLKTDLAPAFAEVKTVIQNDLLPAVTEFIRAITPIVAYVIRVFGPVVKAAFLGTVRTIAAALKVISGIINIFTAVLTGDWSTLWRGVKQIVSGAWAAIKSLFGVGKTNVLASMRALKDGVKGLFGNAISLLYGAGQNIVRGLWNGVKSMGGYISGLVSGFIESKILGPIRRALRLGSPSKATRQYGVFTGQGLALGLLSQARTIGKASATAARALLDPLNNTIDFTTGTARVDVRAAGGAGAVNSSTTLTIDSSGAPMDDFLVGMLRKYVKNNGGDVQVVFGRG